MTTMFYYIIYQLVYTYSVLKLDTASPWMLVARSSPPPIRLTLLRPQQCWWQGCSNACGRVAATLVAGMQRSFYVFVDQDMQSSPPICEQWSVALWTTRCRHHQPHVTPPPSTSSDFLARRIGRHVTSRFQHSYVETSF